MLKCEELLLDLANVKNREKFAIIVIRFEVFNINRAPNNKPHSSCF